MHASCLVQSLGQFALFSHFSHTPFPHFEHIPPVPTIILLISYSPAEFSVVGGIGVSPSQHLAPGYTGTDCPSGVHFGHSPSIRYSAPADSSMHLFEYVL